MHPSRIAVRPFRLPDAHDFLSWAGDDRVTRYFRQNPTLEAAVSYLRDVAIPHPWRRAICSDGDDHPIRYFSARPGSGDSRCRTYVSYAVAAEHWGRGIAIAAVAVAVNRVFQEFPEVVRLEALVDVDNGGYQRVLEKVGFVKEGLLMRYGVCKGEVRDMFIYSFLSTDKVNAPLK